MRSILPAVVALVAYGSLGACQSSTVITEAGAAATIVSGIDPSDIAAIPEPAELGPPVGVSDAVGLDYDAAAVTASVLADVVAATDAQTAVVPAATSLSAADVSKRSYVGSNTNLQRRDRSYPIDTSSYVSIAFHIIETSSLTAKRIFQVATPLPLSTIRGPPRAEAT